MDEFSSRTKAKDGQSGGMDAEIDTVCVRIIGPGVNGRRHLPKQLQNLREGWDALLVRPSLDLGNRKLQHLCQVSVIAQPKLFPQRALGDWGNRYGVCDQGRHGRRGYTEKVGPQVAGGDRVVSRGGNADGELGAHLLMASRDHVQRGGTAFRCRGRAGQNRAAQLGGAPLRDGVVGKVHAAYITVLVMSLQYRFGHFLKR